MRVPFSLGGLRLGGLEEPNPPGHCPVGIPGSEEGDTSLGRNPTKGLDSLWGVRARSQ